MAVPAHLLLMQLPEQHFITGQELPEHCLMGCQARFKLLQIPLQLHLLLHLLPALPDTVFAASLVMPVPTAIPFVPGFVPRFLSQV